MNNCSSKIHRRDWLRTAGAASIALVAGLLPATRAMAGDWPTKPVKIVLAVAAGSTGDTLARMLAPRLEALWKQPVIVENRPGAGGIVGTEYVVNATDGHTLLLGSQSSILPKFTQKSLRFDPLTDLVPIYKVINYEMVIATNAQTAQQAKTLPEFVKLSKSTDKGVFFAGTGLTSVFNLSMAILNKSLGIRYSSVDFNNIGAMNLAVLRGDAQFMVNTPSSIRAHFDNGALVPQVAVSPERYAHLPNVPTIYEAAGYKGYLPVLWAGMFAPKNTPAPVIERIHRDLLTVVNTPEVKKNIESTLSGAVQRSSPAAFAQQIREETEVWRDLFQAMNYKPE